MGFDQIVEGTIWSVDCRVQLIPGCFNDFEEDVVLQLIDKMYHLGDATSCRFPIAAHFPVHDGENAASARHTTSPRAAERKLDSFNAPKEIEDFEILPVGPGSDDNIHWGIDFVLECKDVPARISLFHFRKAGVEAADDVLGVKLSVGAAYGVFQLSGEGVTILRASRSVEVGGEGFHKKRDEVALAKKEVSFQGVEMFEQLEFVVHKIYQPSHGRFVCFIDRSL